MVKHIKMVKYIKQVLVGIWPKQELAEVKKWQN
jgi:hypothetical protein